MLWLSSLNTFSFIVMKLGGQQALVHLISALNRGPVMLLTLYAHFRGKLWSSSPYTYSGFSL